jgi:glutathione S-transferase
MQPLILHHYELSPFSKKIRAIFGYTQLPWQSAITKEMPPRPILSHLTGGYRKIPVAQQGADVFCDTRIICAEIAAITEKQELDVFTSEKAIQEFVAVADSQAFFAGLTQTLTWKMNKVVLQSMSLKDIYLFFKDRITMGRNMNTQLQGPKQSKIFFKQYLQQMERQLDSDFLFGENPTIADFSAYHILWLIRAKAENKQLAQYPRLNLWLDRMDGFGEGPRSSIDPQTALSTALNSQPRAIPADQQQHPDVGRAVTIAPSDYGLDASQGILEASSEHRWIISREDSKAGKVHVHFPKQGFQLKVMD